MKFDADTRTLSFSSAQELEAFHSELGSLVREVTMAVSAGTADANAGAAAAKAQLKRYTAVMRTLNLIRRTRERPDRGEGV